MSLKRLLNSEDGEDGLLKQRIPFNWAGIRDPMEVPVLSDTSWNSYDAELLGSESIQNAAYEPLSFDQSQIEQWDYNDSSSFPIINAASSAPCDHRICYGMIYRTSVHLRGDMSLIDAKLASTNSFLVHGHCQMNLMKIDDQFIVKFPDGTILGEVNVQLERALAGTSEQQYQVDFEVFAPIQPIRETISKTNKEKNAVVRVHINVYGPQTMAFGVGQELSSNKIYLQSPDYVAPGVIYDNPHILKFPDFQTPIKESLSEMEEETPIQDEIQKAEAFKKTISTIYSSLTRGQSLEGLEGNDGLKTKLLPHQKQALAFMTQRESGPIPAEFSLWKQSDVDGRPCTRNVITNLPSYIDHKETGGGILADEMGMGKTLSILALILRTLPEANDWALEVTGDSKTEEYSVRKAGRRSKATLVVASSDLMINEWFQEIERHFHHRVRNALSTIKYHGRDRKAKPEKLCDADIIITTYHTLHSDSKEKSPLHEIEWYRLVLDEAHIIRRQSTVLNRTVSELKARSRWCLTGTPIQNRLEDIGSLFAFLKIIPFNSLGTFRKYIAIPFDEGGKRHKLAIERFTRLLDSLCLRRSKDLLHLPDVQNRVREIEFSPEERKQYEQTNNMMMRAAKNQVGGLDQKSTLGLFQVQLQLRILCNHGTYQQPFSWNRRKLHLIDEREAMEASMGRESEVTCSACRETISTLDTMMFRQYTENCRHVLCSECIDDSDENNLTNCPLCSTLWKQSTAHSQSQHAPVDEKYFRPQGTSSKMEALMKDVRVNVNTTKSIIFSCWTHTLDLISQYLDGARITYRRIDGECPTATREKILAEFAHQPHLRVLIMTTGTGAVGLNLATANRVFIVEPQWNPSVENQAIARALRLGQEQEVEVNRYVVKRTVEQDMRSLQDKKLLLAGMMAWE